VTQCSHESATSVDDVSVDDPTKVWACDACGFRHTIVRDPDSGLVLDRPPAR